MTSRSLRRRSLRAALSMLLAMADVGPVVAASCVAPTLAGANVAGAEFNPGKPDAVHFKDYVYPGPNEVALLKRLGLRLMRVPFAWERMQPEPNAPLAIDEAARLDDAIKLAKASGLTVVLDVHNYGRYRGVAVTSPESPNGALPDLWKRLALRYRNDPDVVFGLMNEPHDIAVDAWAGLAAATLAGIRATGAKNIVLVPGTNWDGAHSWFAGSRSNAAALLPLARGDDRVVFEVHQYFDDNFSGTSDTCGSAARVPPALTAVGAWARQNHVRLFLGEFGVSRKPECLKALDDALAIVERDRDVWYGWTYWSAGAWWGDYMFNLQPPTGEAPQAGVLAARAARLDRGCDS